MSMPPTKANATRRRLTLALVLLGLASFGAAGAEPLTGSALVAALRRGGYVLVMRHASSPSARPDRSSANADNAKMERQLDEAGRTSAKAMGEALRMLHIPIGDLLSSPTYRALETVRIAALGTPVTVKELGDGGQDMRADTEGTRSAWLRSKVTERPRDGTNTVLVTHAPNIAGAFPKEATGLADGETLVFLPDGKGGASVVAHIKIQDWVALSKQ
jgi:phosphohistidine phosphatase SixA